MVNLVIARACLLAAVAALCPAAAPAAPPRGDADCGFNGARVYGSGGAPAGQPRCECQRGWRGPECQQLDLLPVLPGTGLFQPTTSTWGGSIVHGDDGKLYMYASEMVGHCGIGRCSPPSFCAAAALAGAAFGCPVPTGGLRLGLGVGGRTKEGGRRRPVCAPRRA